MTRAEWKAGYQRAMAKVLDAEANVLRLRVEHSPPIWPMERSVSRMRCTRPWLSLEEAALMLRDLALLSDRGLE